MATEARDRIAARDRVEARRRQVEAPSTVRDDSDDEMIVSFPEFVFKEFIVAVGATVFLIIVSIWLQAPLLGKANPGMTPNPSKAPWYFLGLQELLTMFHPMVAGVTIPGMGIFVLMLAPYMDRNPSNKPEDRKFAIVLFTIFLMFWAVLVIIGSFFRGPGFNFVFPWRAGIFFDL
jgi:menaquinol-cytochrome c reductase cytochrome b/c subunit